MCKHEQLNQLKYLLNQLFHKRVGASWLHTSQVRFSSLTATSIWYNKVIKLTVFVSSGRPETVGLFRAGLLHRAPPGLRRQMCSEEALLGHPAAAQAVLQTLHAGQTWGWPPVQPHCSKHQALQEPGDSDQLHLQRLVSRWCCVCLLPSFCRTKTIAFWWNVIHYIHQNWIYII